MPRIVVCGGVLVLRVVCIQIIDKSIFVVVVVVAIRVEQHIFL